MCIGNISLLKLVELLHTTGQLLFVKHPRVCDSLNQNTWLLKNYQAVSVNYIKSVFYVIEIFFPTIANIRKLLLHSTSVSELRLHLLDFP